MISQDQIYFILRLVEAAFLGGLVGLERERSNQPAGLRTHIILCLGSALIMEVSMRVSSAPFPPRQVPFDSAQDRPGGSVWFMSF